MYLKNAHLLKSKTRVWLSILAVTLLVAGATWQGFAANMQAGTASGEATVSTARSAAIDRDSYADTVKIVSPAVVTVRVEARARVTPTDVPQDDMLRRFFGDRFFGDQFGPELRRMPAPVRRGLGSGVMVSTDGYILTNHHVVNGAGSIQIELTDGRTLDAKLIGSDPPSDLALLKVDAANLQAVKLGDSDAVQVGDVVLAVGNPLGIGQTVTMGIVSAKGRSTGVGNGSYEDFLQTDAPINQGNSGGALVNTSGELIGINSQILSPSGGNIGIGFAIPANMALDVMNDLRRDGRVTRAQLGVTIQPVTSDIAESLGLKDVRGAIVSAVEEGSAADRAGIERGDVITAFNGQPVQDLNSLRNRVAATQPGSDATVTVVRNSGERTFTVKLNEAAAPQSAGRQGDAADSQTALGIAVAPLTPDLAARAGLPRDTKGLLVQEVNAGSRAEDAGIEAGDVIQEVNRKPVDSVDALRAEVRASSSRPALLLIAREGRALFVTVRPS
jgi:Do/DeqQ family serine protease